MVRWSLIMYHLYLVTFPADWSYVLLNITGLENECETVLYFNGNSYTDKLVKRHANIETGSWLRQVRERINVHGHYDDVIMSAMASQITSLVIVYSTVYSGTYRRNHQSSASLAFVRGIRRLLVIPRTKGQQRGKCFHLMTSSWPLAHMGIAGVFLS